MKKRILLGVLCAMTFVIEAQGQQVFIPDNQGKAVTEARFENIIGSPYLNESWLKGLVKLKDGQTFKDVDLKYDQVNDQVLFKGKNNEQLRFTSEVLEFKIGDAPVFKNGFKSINGNTTSNYYQVLYDGGVKLLKKTKKFVIEAKGYNSATVTKNVDVNTKYYVVDKDNNIREFKNSKKGFADVFKDKSKEIEQFIAAEKLDLKNDSDLARVFAQYNK